MQLSTPGLLPELESCERKRAESPLGLEISGEIGLRDERPGGREGSSVEIESTGCLRPAVEGAPRSECLRLNLLAGSNADELGECTGEERNSMSENIGEIGCNLGKAGASVCVAF